MTSTTNGIAEVLHGFARADPVALEKLLRVDDWQRIAQQEIERRAVAVVLALDDESLAEIASGAVDLQAILQTIDEDIHAHVDGPIGQDIDHPR